MAPYETELLNGIFTNYTTNTLIAIIDKLSKGDIVIKGRELLEEYKNSIDKISKHTGVTTMSDLLYMMTFSGKKFYPKKPSPNEVDINDIARSLSMMNRFCGHTKFPYSVARHCINCSNIAPEGYKLEALLHDATEAYLSDIVMSLVKYNILHYIVHIIKRQCQYNTTWSYLTTMCVFIDLAPTCRGLYHKIIYGLYFKP